MGYERVSALVAFFYFVKEGEQMLFGKPLTGRKVIYSDVMAVDESNVLDVIQQTASVHEANASETRYLYKYYLGQQPVLWRTKEVRPEICNKIVENLAYSIVNFKTGYLVGEPIQYVSRNNNIRSEDVERLNRFMIENNKAERDVELADWQNICGTSYRLVQQRENATGGECPFEIITLEPKRTYVIYSSRVGHKRLAGVYKTVPVSGKPEYSVYTNTRFFRVSDNKIIESRPYPFGIIPIFEYPANTARVGAFEIVLDLLDAINDFDSNRNDAVAQFVQSLLVLTNCQLPDGTGANEIRQSGLIQLISTSDNPAKIDNLAEQLDQSQNQTLKEDMRDAVLSIVGMPSQSSASQSDSSNNGAVILKNGWQSAEARAKRSESIFRESETEMLRLVLRICRDLSDITSLSVSDINVKFTRRNYEAIGEKATVFATLMGTQYISLVDALAIAGLSYDPEEVAKRGIEWHKALNSAEPTEATNENVPTA